MVDLVLTFLPAICVKGPMKREARNPDMYRARGVDATLAAPRPRLS